ncbi:MAG: efflux RND transporter periplasmic adaptor subunit [Clostridia bacterium]|nr:efflux RND transporter periplasmic adaptor subunit [Clostridia bacterium]
MKTKKIIYVLVSIFILILVFGCGHEETVNEEDQYIPVETELVKVKTLFNEAVFSGKAYANKEVVVASESAGKVLELKARVGAEVKKDEVLFSLDKKDIQKQVDSAYKVLESVQLNYENMKEQTENATINFERIKQLYSEGAVSKTDYEQAKLAASDKGLNAVEAEVEQAEITYGQALDILKDASVKSPIEGIVSVVNIEEGQTIDASVLAINVIDMDRVYVEINVTEKIINYLSVGQEVKVEIESVSGGNFVGTLDRVSPSADAETQLYPIRAYIDNKDHVVKPGMFANIIIPTEVREAVMAVRSEAVVTKEGKNIVYVVVNNKAVAKEVVLGLNTGDYVEVLGGLSIGDELIIKGQNYVKDTSVVKVVGGTV